MKTPRSTSLRLLPAALVAIFFATGASGQVLAQGASDCYAIGQQVAAQNGGTLAMASAESRGGQLVCRIVVLVPGRDGERPRRAEFIIPVQ